MQGLKIPNTLYHC